jgi:hypothetical protein
VVVLNAMTFCPVVGETEGVPGSRGSERSRGAIEPRAGRSAVEASRRGGLVRVGDRTRSKHSVEPASYEADLSHAFKWAVFRRGLAVLTFILR